MPVILSCCDCGKKRKFSPSELSGACSRYVVPGGVYRCRSCWDLFRKNAPRKTKPTKTYSVKSVKAVGVEVVCLDCGLSRRMKRSVANRTSGLCKSCSRKGERAGQWKGGKVTLTCLDCGAIKSVSQSRAQASCRKDGRYYCSVCALRHREGADNPAWRGGVARLPYPVEWNSRLRSMIRGRDANTCAVCGRQFAAGRMPVHHIDYDKSNCDPCNLITLCASCHSKTNYRRELWQKWFAEKMKTCLTNV